MTPIIIVLLVAIAVAIAVAGSLAYAKGRRDQAAADAAELDRLRVELVEADGRHRAALQEIASFDEKAADIRRWWAEYGPDLAGRPARPALRLVTGSPPPSPQKTGSEV